MRQSTDYGEFADLVPQKPKAAAPRPKPTGGDYGEFADLVPAPKSEVRHPSDAKYGYAPFIPTIPAELKQPITGDIKKGGSGENPLTPAQMKQAQQEALRLAANPMLGGLQGNPPPQSPRHPSDTAYDAKRTPKKSTGQRIQETRGFDQRQRDLAKLGSGDLGTMAEGAVGIVRGLFSSGTESVREGAQQATEGATKYLQKNFPQGLLLRPELAAEMDKLGPTGKMWKETIKNLDPSQAVPFVNSITKKAEANGESGLAAAGRGVMDIFRRIADGDENAGAELMGMWNAFAIAGATSVAVKGLKTPAPKTAPVEPKVTARPTIDAQGMKLKEPPVTPKAQPKPKAKPAPTKPSQAQIEKIIDADKAQQAELKKSPTQKAQEKLDQQMASGDTKGALKTMEELGTPGAKEARKAKPGASSFKNEPKLPPRNALPKGATQVDRIWKGDLYRETSVDRLGEVKQAGGYWSNTPDLALGQGENKGVLVQFRPTAGATRNYAQINKAKPGWEVAYDSGAAEIVNPYDLAGDIVSLTIKDAKRVDPKFIRRYDMFVEEGKFVKSVNSQGQTVYTAKKFAEPPNPPQKTVQGTKQAKVAEPPAVKVAPEPEGVKGQALANRITNIVSKRIGEPEYRGVPREKITEWAKAADEQGLTNPDRAQSIAREVIDGTRRSFTKEETVGMGAALDDLTTRWEDVSKRLEATAERGGDIKLSDELEDIRRKITDITKSGNMVGAEWGRTGVARQAMMKADNSFGGLIARRQKAAERELTTDEIKQIKQEADELRTVREQQDARIRQLEEEAAQRNLRVSGGSKPSADKVASIDAKIKDVSTRLKTKWAESKPESMARSSALFGADIAAEQVARVGKIAPEILELARLYAQKGAIKLADNTREVVKHLKRLGIDDVEDNDVAAVLAGRIKGEREPVPPTTYEALKKEASDAFTKAADERRARASFVEKKAREARDKARSDQRKSDLEALRKEEQELRAEERAAKDAERAFWKDVREREKGFQQSQRDKAKADRDESTRRWKASVQGERAAALNRIEEIQKKLDFFEEQGQVLGAKSDLERPFDAQLNELQIKEAALRNRMDKIEKEMAAKAEFDRMDPSMRFVKKWNPWGVARSTVASVDNSFPMNQGGLALFSDPKSWSRGARDSFRSLSEAGLERVQAEIRADKVWYERAESANLFEGVANLEDIFGAERISKVPLISHSQRAYEGAADAMRFDLFKRWSDLAQSWSSKPLTVDDYKQIASNVKTWTGQGEWGKGLTHISKPFFALRYRLSQFENGFGAPMVRAYKHGKATGQWAPFKVMLAKYGQAYATAFGTLTILSEALKASGASVQLDMNRESTNYGRLVFKRGKTTQTWDVLPSAMRNYGLITKIVNNRKVTMGGTIQDGRDFQNRGLRTELVGEYITNGAHPVPRAFWSYLQGQDAPDKKHFGKSQDFPSTGAFIDLGISFAPISAQTWKEIWENSDLSVTEKLLSSGLVPFISSNTIEKSEYTPEQLARQKRERALRDRTNKLQEREIKAGMK